MAFGVWWDRKVVVGYFVHYTFSTSHVAISTEVEMISCGFTSHEPMSSSVIIVRYATFSQNFAIIRISPVFLSRRGLVVSLGLWNLAFSGQEGCQASRSWLSLTDLVVRCLSGSFVENFQHPESVRALAHRVLIA